MGSGDAKSVTISKTQIQNALKLQGFKTDAEVQLLSSTLQYLPDSSSDKTNVWFFAEAVLNGYIPLAPFIVEPSAADSSNGSEGSVLEPSSESVKRVKVS